MMPWEIILKMHFKWKKWARQVSFFIRLPCGEKTAGEMEVWANLGAIVHLGWLQFSAPSPRFDNLCYWPNFVFAFSSAAIRKSLAMILGSLVHAGLVCGRAEFASSRSFSFSLRQRCFLPRYYLSSLVVSSTPGFSCARRQKNGGKSRVFLPNDFSACALAQILIVALMEGELFVNVYVHAKRLLLLCQRQREASRPI